MSDNKARHIYLLRHGKIALKKNEQVYIGHIDIPLSDEGICQARSLQEKFAGMKIAAVFCSDLTRSVQTAKLIAEKLDAQVQSRFDLREISMGEWEGKSFREIAQTYPAEYAKRGQDIAHYRIPGAESFAECKSRIVAAFTDIVNTTAGDLIIVGHAGSNRLLLSHILGMPIENIFRISQDYGCVNKFIGSGGQYRVKLINGSI